MTVTISRSISKPKTQKKYDNRETNIINTDSDFKSYLEDRLQINSKNKGSAKINFPKKK